MSAISKALAELMYMGGVPAARFLSDSGLVCPYCRTVYLIEKESFNGYDEPITCDGCKCRFVVYSKLEGKT